MKNSNYQPTNLSALDFPTDAFDSMILISGSILCALKGF